MRTPSRAAAFVVVPLLVTAAGASAQTPPKLEAAASLDVLVFDNFFQAPAPEDGLTVTATRLLGRVGGPLDADHPVKIFGEIGRTWYSEFSGSTIFGGITQVRDRMHSLDAAVRYELDRPTLDVGDQFGQANVFSIDTEYGYRLNRDWEVKGLFDLQRQAYAVQSERTNTIFGVGGAVRYRGFGSSFSPEVGLLTGTRSVVDPSENHSQTDFYVKVRSTPTPPVYLSVRYRYRARDYSVDALDDRNFGREDRRSDLTALAAIVLARYLTLNVYYAFQDANSTVASRTFTNQLLSFGLTVSR